MPLKAILDGTQIQSFNLDEIEWASLKNTYKDHSLIMPCCQRRTIPKTSKLGTQYFAHLKRGDCTSNPETAEHIHLKYLVAKAVQQCGWEVTTEYAGSTPDGEEWIADVFCQKGDAKLVLEIQWSHQTDEEYDRRTQRYKDSNVRCVWLYRVKGRKEVYLRDESDFFYVPRFGFRFKEDKFLISRYEICVESFILGVFEKKLAWFPKPNELLITRVCYVQRRCWRCKKPTKVVMSLDVYNADKHFIESFSFSDDNIAHWITSRITNKKLSTYGIGALKHRYSKTAGTSYMSNGCIHCDALWGKFLSHYEFDDEEEYLEFQWHYDESEISIEAGWFFEGSRGKTFY